MNNENVQIIEKQLSIPFESMMSQEDCSIDTKNEPKQDLMQALFGSVSEVCTDLNKSTKQFAVALYKDGIWEKRENQIGTFIFKRQELKDIPFVSQTITPSFSLKVNKLPINILKSTVNLFKDIMKTMNNSESMVQIFLDTENNKYLIYVPEQYVSGASIRFLHNQEYQNNEKLLWVLDIHSHNTMNAFFSGGDDRDEKSTRIYGVLGQLDREEYASKWRAGCDGKYFNLSIDDIFDVSSTEDFVIDSEEFKKIKSLRDMPDSLKNHVTAVGSTVQLPPWAGQGAPRQEQAVTRTYNVYDGYQGNHINRSLARMHNRYSYMFNDDDDDNRRVSRRHIAHDIEEQYITSFDLSASHITHRAWNTIDTLVEKTQERFNEPPTIMIEGDDDRSYDNSSQILFEVLEETLRLIYESLGKDLSESEDWDIDLVDSCVYMAHILMLSPNCVRHVNALMHEMQAIKKFKEEDRDS